MTRAALVPALLLVACGAPADDEPSCADGPEAVGVMTSLRFSPQVDGGISEGFDLDGRTSDAGDPAGCGLVDDAGVDGTPGVDNAFARLLPALALTPLGAVDSVLADMIADGTLLLLPRFRGLDDTWDDACAELEVVRGEGLPAVGAGGVFLADQTFEPRADVAPAVVGPVAVREGVVDGEGFEIAFDVAYLGVSVRFRLLDARIQTTFDEDGRFHGVLAGGVDRRDVLDLAGVPGLDPSVLGIVDGLMASVADLEPDETGACTRISTTFLFEGERAFLLDGDAGP